MKFATQPPALDVAAAADNVIGKGVGVAAKPDIDRSGMSLKVTFEALRLWLVIDKIKIRRAFRHTVDAVIPAVACRAIAERDSPS